MKVSYKICNYEKPIFKCYYITINNVIFGSCYLSLKEVEEAILVLTSGVV